MAVHHRRFWTAAFLLSCFAASAQSITIGARSQSAPHHPEATALECRVLETHASEHPAVRVAVFHQRDKQDQTRLASLLRQHFEVSVQFQTADGVWQNATVIRLKSCFGRGLLLMPTGTAQLKDGDEFLLKFPPY